MTPLILALVGLPIGLVLDALIVRLAVMPDDDEDGESELPEESASEPNAWSAPALGAETGTLVLAAEHPGVSWSRRLIVVAATAGLFAIAGARFDGAHQLAVVTAYIAVLLICAGTDALVYRVPNVVTYPAILGATVVGALMPGAAFYEVLAGGALAGGLLLLPSILTGGLGMGMGDVKLAAFVGLALGFTKVVPALIFMALGGGLVAVLLLLLRFRKRGEPIPYAPFISIGAIVTLLWFGAAFETLS